MYSCMRTKKKSSSNCFRVLVDTIDTPNHEHGHYDDDEDIDEEAPTGDTDITAT